MVMDSTEQLRLVFLTHFRTAISSLSSRLVFPWVPTPLIDNVIRRIIRLLNANLTISLCFTWFVSFYRIFRLIIGLGLNIVSLCIFFLLFNKWFSFQLEETHWFEDNFTIYWQLSFFVCFSWIFCFFWWVLLTENFRLQRIIRLVRHFCIFCAELAVSNSPPLSHYTWCLCNICLRFVEFASILSWSIFFSLWLATLLLIPTPCLDWFLFIFDFCGKFHSFLSTFCSTFDNIFALWIGRLLLCLLFLHFSLYKRFSC